MFINSSEELKIARVEGYALGAFNTSNLEVTKAICAAAAKLSHPILIQTTPSSIKYAGLKQIFEIVKNEIDETGVKAGIHIDHAKEFEVIKDCIDIGYKSVMVDGSKLSFEENVALTKKVVEYAHAKNVSVEAEIGVIGTEEGGESSGAGSFSDPEQTLQFVKLTGIDSVAVSVGNEHGAPDAEKLNLDLLRTLSELISIPLVMHGASGLSDSDIQEAIKLGVAKINIDTNIRRAVLEGMRNIDPETKDYRDVFKHSMELVTEVVIDRIKAFHPGLE